MNGHEDERADDEDTTYDCEIWRDSPDDAPPYTTDDGERLHVFTDEALAARDARVAAAARADALREAADDFAGMCHFTAHESHTCTTLIAAHDVMLMLQEDAALRAATEDRCTCGVGDHRPPGAHGIHCADPDASAATEDRRYLHGTYTDHEESP